VTLDLARIVGRLDDLVVEADAQRDHERFDALRRVWGSADGATVERRLVGAKTTFLVARGQADYRHAHPEPASPADYVVAATDGSLVLPNRHSPARFYIMNTGLVRLEYGACSNAWLASDPSLHFGDDELTVPNDIRRQPVNEAILGLRRSVAELEAGIDLVAGSPVSALAMQDGTLILWRLEGQSEAVREWVLKDYVAALRRYRELDIPIVSYISAPGSADLMNAMRIASCDYPTRGVPIDCDHCRGRFATEAHLPACDILPAITDRALLGDLGGLRPGERTDVFTSASRVIGEYVSRGGPEMEIRFFYLHTGLEIARIEAPRWVTDDPAHLNLVHSVVLDQCRLGKGYPVVLQEAHEQAVIGMEDRRIVELAVERALSRAGVVLTWTGKDGSKRGRFV
jgi:hypothetical protein